MIYFINVRVTWNENRENVLFMLTQDEELLFINEFYRISGKNFCSSEDPFTEVKNLVGV